MKPTRIGVALAVMTAVAPANVARAQATQGIALFAQRCATCHTPATANRSPATSDRAPTVEALRERTPESILDALTTGSMAENAAGLTDAQKRIIAEQLTGRPLGALQAGHASAMPNRCEAKPFADPAKAPMWNGWGADIGNSRFQTAEAAGLPADRISTLKLKWAFGFPNGSSAFAQPTIVGGRVFVGADTGFVYALDARSGCVYWSFQAQAGVRTAVSIGPAGDRYAAYFGDLKGNVYAVDAENGRRLWTRRADAHPMTRITGAPTLDGGRLYVPLASLEEASGANPTYECCTFRGGIVAYDARTGEEVWKRYAIFEPPAPTKKNSLGTQLYGPAGAAVWSAPTIDSKRGVLYFATGNAYTDPAPDTSDAVIALDLKTGLPKWTRQLTPKDSYVIGCGPTATTRDNCPEDTGPDFDFGNSPILRTLPNGRSVIVIGQKSGVAWALDPDRDGAVLWQRRVGKGSALGGMEWGSAADDRNGYFPVADASSGPAEAGGLYALDLATGEERWHMRPAVDCPPNDRTCVPAQSAAASVIPGVVFSGTTSGLMRAYSTSDGRVLWEYNTAREFPTVNGVPAKGGSINGPGPTIAGGLLLMTSGYAYLGGGMPGNVLLAFGVE